MTITGGRIPSVRLAPGNAEVLRDLGPLAGLVGTWYAQMVELDFPIFTVLNPPGGGQGRVVDLGWPHISVATLRKSFNA